ncbi:MAG: T9SS type A sorting domain-containing protein [Saprospiraceae bacterium]|nr:T9SS type A sorting domain-containing protein [Saprospiraceae bacterium]
MKQLLGIALFFFIGHINSHGQIDAARMYMFGHSLVNYESASINGDEGKIAHWLYLLASADNHTFAATGQYGFLPSHTNLPPSPNWGFQLVPPVWDADNNETFADADFNSILLTPGNFMQWQPAYFDYPTDPGLSPLSATQIIFDWVDTQEEGVRFYLYENWPDMAPFLNNGFPANATEMDAYHDYTQADFNDWWLEYQDSLLSSRPNLEVRMIPVGPILSKLQTDFFTMPIPVTDLYEDDAPHGTTNTYFLASLITYMSVFETPAPLNFDFPNSIHSNIQNQFPALVDFIWNELQNFNDQEGNSRVFFENISTNTAEPSSKLANRISIYPNPNNGFFELNANKIISGVQIFDSLGRLYYSQTDINQNKLSINISNMPQGVYQIMLKQNNTYSVQKFIVK